MSELTVELSGSYREQGRQHGEALAAIIEEVADETLAKRDLGAEQTRWVIGLLEENFQRLAPGALEEMRGISEGSGVPYEKLFAYNCCAAISAADDYCSAVGWADTPDGPIIGKTNDIGQNKAKYHHPFRRRSGEGLAAVWATWPGTVWSNCFVNAAGLAYGGASLNMHARNEAGIDMNCLLRVLMDRCSSIDEMLELFDRVPIVHSPQHNVMCDEQGKQIAVEHTPEGCHVCQGPGEPFVRGTNHFCPGPFQERDTSAPEMLQNSRDRFANLGRLSERLSHNVDNMLRVVQDHSEVGQICQHGNAEMWSSTAYVAIPSQRCIVIGRGQPCEAEFFELSL